MEKLELHINTQQTIQHFRNLNKEQKHNFFKEIEKEIEFFYLESFLTDNKKQELDRRTEEIESGKVQMIPWENVKAELQENYGL